MIDAMNELRSKYCNHCGKELVDTNWFCNIECETNYRNENNELYILNNDDTYDWYCPVIELNEADDELQLDNGHHVYNIKKSDIKKWKVDKCTCLQEFTDINIKVFDE